MLPENVDIHLFRNREGKWVIRVPIEAVRPEARCAGQTYYYTEPRETTIHAFTQLYYWLLEPSDFHERVQKHANEQFQDPEFCAQFVTATAVVKGIKP